MPVRVNSYLSDTNSSSISVEISQEELDALAVISYFTIGESLKASHLKDRSLKGHDLKNNGIRYKVINDRRTSIEDANIEKCILTLIKKDSDSYINQVFEKHTLELFLHHQPERADGQNYVIESAMLDGNNVSPEIRIISNIAYLYRLKKMQDKITESLTAATNYMHLIYNYKSTLELAEAYNKAEVFTLIVKKEGESDRAVNIYEERLLKVARELIYIYNKAKDHSIEEALDLANLSALKNKEISQNIYNALINVLETLNPKSLEIINCNKIKAVARMLRLLPPDFLAQKHADTILIGLSKMSDWLKNQKTNIKSVENHVDQLIPILELYADMISGLLDNIQLQQMDIINNQCMSVSVMISNYLSRLRNGNIRIGQDKMTFSKRLSGVGLDKKVRETLKAGFDEMLKIPSIPIKYLASYITESIERIPQKGDTDAAQIIRRSKHLILGVSGLGLLAVSGGGTLSDFQDLCRHGIKAMTDNRSNRGDWYDDAKDFTYMITETAGDTEKLKVILEKICEFYEGNQDKVMRYWQLTYIILESLSRESNKESDESLKNDILNFAKEVAMKKKSVIELKEVCIDFLIAESSSNLENIRNTAISYIKDHFTPTEGDQTLRKLPPGLIDRIKSIDLVQHKPQIPIRKNNSAPNKLLNEAKRKAFPVEEKLVEVRSQVELLFRESPVNESLKNYIPLIGARSKYSTEQSQFFSLEKKVLSFIEDKSFLGASTLLIHGIAGAGKSLFCRYIEKKYWSEYQQGGTIPLFISLPSLQNSSHKAIEQALLSYGFTQEDIMDLKKEDHRDSGCVKKLWHIEKNEDGSDAKDESGNKIGVEEVRAINAPRLLLILDGYDEINGKMKIHAAYETSSWKSIKVIITSRTDYLDNLPKADLFASNVHNSYEEVFIRPFDKSQIKSFISNYCSRDEANQGGLLAEDFENMVLYNKDILSIIEHTFVLEIVMEVLPKLKEKKDRELQISTDARALFTATNSYSLGKVTRYEIYDLFLTSWFKREGLRQRKNAPSLPNGFDPELSAACYATDVALFMFEHNTQNIKGRGYNYSRYNGVLSESAHFFDDDVKKNLSREAGPFKRMGEMNYSFIHKSIQEFLVAKGMLEEARSFIADPTKNINRNSNFNRGHVQKDPSVLRFILDNITQSDLIALEKIMLSTRHDTMLGKRSPIVIAAANAATLYVRTYYTQIVIDRDWSNTQISGADISGAYFYNMKFSGSYWDNVTADSLVMVGSECDNMELTNLNLGQCPPLKSVSQVKSIFVSGEYLFSGLENNKIFIWNISSGNPLRELEGHLGCINSVCASREHVFSGSGDCSVRMWDIASGTLIKEFNGHEGSINSVFVDGKHILSGSDDATVKIWDISSGVCTKVLSGHAQKVNSVYSGEGYVFSGSGDKTVRIWDGSSGRCEEVLSGHHNEVNSVYSYGKHVFSGSGDKTVRIWSVEGGECLKVLIGHKRAVNSVYAYKEYVFSGSGDETVRIWDIASGECLKLLTGHEGLVNSVFVDGQYIYSGSSDRTIRIWDRDMHAIIGHDLHKDILSSMLVGDNYIYTLSKSNKVIVWDRNSGSFLNELDDTIDDFCTDDRYLCSIIKSHDGMHNKIMIWDIISRQSVGVIEDPDNNLFKIVCVYGGNIFSSSYDNIISVWSIETKSLIKKLEGHTGIITSIYADEGHVFSGSHDKKVRVWDLGLGESKVLDGHTRAINRVLANYSRVFSSAYDCTIRIWDRISGECLKVLRGDCVGGVFSVSDKYLFSLTRDNVAIKVFNIDTYSCLGEFASSSAKFVEIRASKSEVLSLDSTGLISVWDFSDLENVRMTSALGRKSWEQPLSFVRNTAESLYGLSQQNQRLFEQYDFKPYVKESIYLQCDDIEVLGDRDLIVSVKGQLDLVRDEVSAIKDDVSAIKEQQSFMTLMLKGIFVNSGGDLSSLEVPAENSTVTSSSLSAAAADISAMRSEHIEENAELSFMP